MKEFTELLKDNKVKPPRTKISRIWWSDAESLYKAYCAIVEERKGRWEGHRAKLQEYWGETFPELFELEALPTFTFKNHQEAEKQIRKEIERLGHTSLMSLRIKLDRDARSKWLQELADKAGADCKLIVVKGCYYPNELDKKKFEESVKSGKPGSIDIMGFSPIWVAFDPHKKYDTLSWCMDKMHSTVEYIY